MIQQRIPYSEYPVEEYRLTLVYWLHYADLTAIPVYTENRPSCPEHGQMAQGFDYWYCEDCENMNDNDRGLYIKYHIQKVNGDPISGFAFVLRIKDPHARNAMMAYAESVRKENPQLADDLEARVSDWDTRHS